MARDQNAGIVGQGCQNMNDLGLRRQNAVVLGIWAKTGLHLQINNINRKTKPDSPYTHQKLNTRWSMNDFSLLNCTTTVTRQAIHTTTHTNRFSTTHTTTSNWFYTIEELGMVFCFPSSYKFFFLNIIQENIQITITIIITIFKWILVKYKNMS